jgi:hypothetical protein
MTVQDVVRHHAYDGLVSVEGMPSQRPETKHEAEDRDEDHGGSEDSAGARARSGRLPTSRCLDVSFALQRRSSMLDPAARANWDH